MKVRPIDERFWEKISHNKESGCWEWTEGTTKGYGNISRAREEVRRHGGARRIPAHRYAYEMLVGPIPEGLVLDHLCRNRRCVNPEHLDPIPHGLNVLRGETLSAINKAKTHCIQGHEFSESNTRRRKKSDGSWRRECMACDRAAANRRRRARGVPEGTKRIREVPVDSDHLKEDANV